MVENYRHGVGANLLELPEGFIDKNEDPSKAAERELLEETGYMCDILEYLNWFYTWPGKTIQRNFVYITKGLKENSKQKSTEYLRNKLYNNY
jgi:ADP-ribose pyrophosphatase